MSGVRLTIGLKLGVGFAGVVLLLCSIAVAGWHGMNGVVRIYEDEALRIAEAARLAESLEKRIVDQARHITTWLLVGESRYVEEFERARRSAEQVTLQLRTLIRSQEGRALLEPIVDAATEYAAEANVLFEYGRVSEAGQQAGRNLLSAEARLSQAVSALIEYQARRLAQVKEEIAAARHRAQSIMLALALFTFLAAALVGVALTRTIVGPVRRTARAALRLADGDLTVPALSVRTRDEIEDMAQAFNQMMGTWRDVLGQIRRTSGLLNESGERLLTVAEEAAQATGQIAAAIHEVAHGAGEQVRQAQQTQEAVEQLRQAIDQIAAGAHHQAEKAEQTTRSLEQMARSIEEVSGSAGEVAEAAARGAERARAGDDAVRQVVDGMEQIRAAVARVAQRIKDLGEYSRQIDQIVVMISDIAEQTNLLALNAAIEAARAGEHGRGFGVVAEEVRRLAQRSAEATREIGALIKSIQGAVDAAIGETEASTLHVATGSELAGNARAALEEIVAAIRTTDALARAISQAAANMAAASPAMLQAMAEMASVTQENSAATQEMAASSSQVLRAMDEVVSISEQTAASTQEVSASTEEMSASAEELKASVETLTRLAADLERIVQRFRL